jgi:hypothetical protein
VVHRATLKMRRCSSDSAGLPAHSLAYWH